MSYYTNNKKRSASERKTADEKYAEALAAIEKRGRREAVEAAIPDVSNQFSISQAESTSGESSRAPGGMEAAKKNTPPKEPPQKKQQFGVPRDPSSLKRLAEELRTPKYVAKSAPSVPSGGSYASVAAAAATSGDIEMGRATAPDAPAAKLPINQNPKPQEDRLSYRKVPQALRVPAVLQIERAQDMGSLRPPKDEEKSTSFRVTATIDFGRYSLPALAISIIAPQPDPKLEAKQMDIDWQPGVEGQSRKPRQKKYQIEDLMLQDNQDEDFLKGVENPQLLAAAKDPKQRERLIKISWTGHDGRIHLGKGVNKGNFTQFAKEAERNTIKALTTCDSTKLTIWLLLPTGMTALNDFRPHLNEDGGIGNLNMFGFFKVTYDHRTPPYAYLSKDFGHGALDVHEEMAHIDIAGNRMLVRYPRNQEDWLQEKENDPTFPAFEYPVAPEFHEYDAQLYYGSKEEFVKVIGTSHVRQYQYEQGEYARLALGQHSIKVRKPIRITKKHLKATQEFRDTQVDNSVTRKRHMMYGYVTLNQSQDDTKSSPLPVPVSGSIFKIDFEGSDLHNERIHHNKHIQWNGYVKEMAEEEKAEVPDADFLLLFSRPHGGLNVDAADDFEDMRSQRISLTHVVNSEPSQRVLEAIKELANPSRTDMDDVLWPLIYHQEHRISAREDLTRGPDNTDENARIYEDAVKELKANPPKFTDTDGDEHGFTEDQVIMFTQDWKKVPNRLKLILGPAGSQKTTTLAWSCVLLTLVGHRIEVLSEQNEAANKCCRLMYKLSEYAKQNYRFGERLKVKKMIRFLPHSYGVQALRRPLERVNLSDGKIVIGKAHADADGWRDWPEVLAMWGNSPAYLAEQKMSRDPDNDGLQQAITDRHCADLGQLKEDHVRLDDKERVFDLPNSCSVGYHLERLKDENPAIMEGFEVAEAAVDSFEEGQGNFRNVHAELSSQVCNLVGIVLESADIVVSTYVSAAHELCRKNFKPTIVAHENSSQTRVVTAATGLSLCNIRCHIFVGDEHQLPPHSAARKVDEFCKTTRVSILKWFLQKGVPYTRLRTQCRMHPSIFRFPNEAFYDESVENAECTKRDNTRRQLFRKMVKERYGRSSSYDEASQYFGVNVKYGVSAPVLRGTSLQNYASAAAVAGSVQDLIRLGGNPSDIVVLCYYAGQRSRIRSLLKDGDIEVHTVDKFQGSDKPFVFIDVTAAPAPHIRFDGIMGTEATESLSGHVLLPERLCMALTRAGDGLLVFGNFGSWDYKHARGDAAYLEGMTADMVKRHVVLHDDTHDTSPLVQALTTSEEAMARYEAAIRNADEVGWMNTTRGLSRTVNQRPKNKGGKFKSVEYAGEHFGRAYGPVPSTMREEAQKRANREGAEWVAAQPKPVKKAAATPTTWTT